jgi:hypothetical protein
MSGPQLAGIPMFHRSGLVWPYVPWVWSRPVPSGPGSGQTRSADPASAEDGDRCRHWRERSQADRGFDGEPPLHAGHFGLDVWHGGPSHPHNAGVVGHHTAGRRARQPIRTC